MATLRDLQAELFDKINPAVKFSVTRYVMAVGFFVAVVGFGIVSILHLGVDLLPVINIPVVVVQTTYTGADPTVMDQQVTQIIEKAVSTVQGITDINSTSSTGTSRVVLSFDMSTDKNADANQVAAKVSQAAKNLPINLTTPPAVVTFDVNSAPIIQFGVSAEGVTMDQIGTWVNNDLALQLERLDGVANVTVDGAPQRTFNVLLDPNKLATYGLLPQDVTNAIAGSAVTQPIGSIVAAKNTITFSTNNLPDSADQISKILVNPTKGISVGAVAFVQDYPAPSNYDRVNGVPSVIVSVIKTVDGNEVAVAKEVRQFLAKKAFPTGFKLTYSNDTTGPITASIESTYHELFLTAGIVAIICLLFLGKLNTAFSVILAIPIALSASPVLYNLCGFSFNLVSLQAMIVGIGIVVDDSIVVSENVERYRRMGYSLMESVLKGASEVFSAVMAASLSLLAVLLPISFLGGIIGQYIMQFSLGLAAAVFFSLLEAVLFLTVRLAYTPEAHTFDWRDFLKSWVELPRAFAWAWTHWNQGLYVLLGVFAAIIFPLVGSTLVPHVGWMAIFLVVPLWPVSLGVVFYVTKIVISGLQAITTNLHHLTEKGVEWVRENYAGSLEFVLGHAGWVMGGAGVIFVGTVLFFALVSGIPFNFVPTYDSGTIVVSAYLPPNTPPSITNELSGRVEAWLASQKEVVTTQTIVSTGWGTGRSGVFTITSTLGPIETRRNSALLTVDWRKAIFPMVVQVAPSAHLAVSAGGSMGGGGASTASLSLTLTTVDYNLLVKTNDEVIAALNANPQVTDVNSSIVNTTEDDFFPDPDKLTGTGLSSATAALALQTYATGVQAANAEIGGLAYPINVQLDPSFLHSTQSLLDLPVYSPTLGTSVTAGQLGHFVMDPAPATLTRYNRLYSAQLDINLIPSAPPILVFKNTLIKELTDAGILNGSISLGDASKWGPTALAAQLQTAAPVAFLLAMFLVYLVMGAQFNSWKYPVYLLLPVPLAVVGALWLVFFVGGGLDVFGMLGMLMLIGLSAKNAIIYLDFVVERLEVMPLKEALIDSARLRFRPIVMTTLTVLVISFPLIFSTGQGSEFGRVLGIVMMGGIVTSAVLTFFVVPAAFWLFERRHYQERVLGLHGPHAVAAVEAGPEHLALTEGPKE
jgi:HAE1 family hydrophobic/amphiphilic exporter-1